ncbi:MAG: deoxyribodipyrimidine photo-lyase, partial [Betaproteobacteria bacterium]|nr:deoxyribodipyrimidine photo-lyase [Betaproteobacteria bacterium]
ASAVLTNEDYEPQAIARDRDVAEALSKDGIAFHAFKDTVVFEKDEVLTQAGKPFSVFTPYKNAWLKTLTDFHLKAYPVGKYAKHLARAPQDIPLPSMESMGFARTNVQSLTPCGARGAQQLLRDFVKRIDSYKEARDYPAVKGVSYLSVHNRFGTVSIRQLATLAHAETLRKTNTGAATWLSELIWRDFYFQILWHHPHVATSAFRPEYNALRWENNDALFRAWCEARTGYPIIDAAMRQLNQTGYMHNRLRMIVASFLTKDLLIDWRFGEKYFADHLNDFDLAANNGGWQWAASTGCDAQPYFRIFNPVTQSERFDPQGKFIRRYVPELSKVHDKFIHAPWTMPPMEQQACGISIGRDYPLPVVDHAVQREKALAMYKRVKQD